MMMRYRVQVLKIENPYYIKSYKTILMFVSNTSIISAVHTKKLLFSSDDFKQIEKCQKMKRI